MSEITINFETLKFNLYEILNISKDASEPKIKKAFRNLILYFHPDKNSEAEEDIYQHIIIANQVLTNKDSRRKYDNFLNNIDFTHEELKIKFNKIKNEIKTKDDATLSFTNKIEELNKKHMNNFQENDTNTNYKKMIKMREIDLNISKEEIKDLNDFNTKFENKLSKGPTNQIISSNEDMQLSTINVNDNYTQLDVAFDNLYIDSGGISTSKYTSLDNAFKIQQFDLSQKKNISIEEALTNYKKETEHFNDINFKFNNEKFDSWNN
jgi:curved DNA-binding protein CbpA